MHAEWVVVGVTMAGIVSGATGLAFPLVATPFFMLIYPPPQAILITALCSLTGQLFSVALLHRSVRFEPRWPLLLAGLAGVPLGTLLLLRADTEWVRIGFGTVLALSCLWSLFGRRVHLAATSRWREAVVGFAGGVCGGMFGVSAAIPSIWLSSIDKAQQRAIIQPYIITAQCASFVLLYAHGLFDAQLVEAAAFYAAPLLAGIALGAIAFRFLSGSQYSVIVILLTLTSGCVLLAR